MPFCRKCGRRLVKYSESCPDCGTSTTAPIIKVKKGSGLNFKGSASSKKIAKAMIPENTIVTVKTVPQTVSTAKLTPQSEIVKITILNAPAKIVTTTKKEKVTTISQGKNAAPAKAVTHTKPAVSSKLVLSAKHIVKPKKTTPAKPTAPFTIAHARPVATFTAVQPKPVTQSIPVVQPKLIAQSVTATPTKPTPSPKPITPAVVYPPHQIIKTNISLKKDFLSHPQDYETQTFGFDLKCPNDHFWPAGNALPVSNGRALCPQCGERLRKNKQTRRKRRYRYFT